MITPNEVFVNDYRNGVVAEGMKVLGFVNRYSRGVQTVQDELKSNGNGEAEFKLHLVTAFLVVEKISSYASSEPNKEPKKEPNKEPKKELFEVLEVIKVNPRITYRELMLKFGIKESATYERVRKLKAAGLLRRKGGRFGGSWIVKN